jgi:branched-chain amino acid aminotransferase|tara:strand:- start:1058 stop:1825 length:768 start_codon:yes stop_codon:yes gene_type:complete
MNSYFDGQYIPLDQVRISPLDFGFIHSHATYDVMRGLTHFDKHYDRFVANCEYYGFTPPDKDHLIEIISNLNHGDMFIWLIMWKGTPPSGSPRDMSGPDHFLVYTKPYYPIASKPITLKMYNDIPRSPGYQTHKNFSWIELTKAQQSVEDCDTALVRNIDGYVNEGPGFGVCFIENGTVYTPKTDVLNSVTIQVVEEICERMNIPFVRADFTKIDFKECFICSTSGGITPVASLNTIPYSHDITKRIQEAYDNLC